MSQNVNEIKGIFGLIAMGGFLFWKGFRNLVLHRKVTGLATSRARSLAMGLVELEGRARMSTTPRLDPIFNEACCYFQLKVERYQRSGKHGRWVTIYEDSSDGTGFFCRDATGEILIMPKNPDLYFPNRLRARNGLFGTNNPVVSNFLSRWHGSLRLTLYVVRQGDPLYVIGCARSGRGSGWSSQTTGPMSLGDAARELKANPQAMKGLDRNKDGQVDAQEWEFGLQKYREFLEAKRLKAATSNTASEPVAFEGVVTETSEHQLVLASSEKQLVSALNTFLYLQIIGGGIALASGFTWLFLRFGLS